MSDIILSSALVNKGNVIFKKGDYEKAREFFREALQNDSSCIEALYNLGKFTIVTFILPIFLSWKCCLLFMSAAYTLEYFHHGNKRYELLSERVSKDSHCSDQAWMIRCLYFYIHRWYNGQLSNDLNLTDLVLLLCVQKLW